MVVVVVVAFVFFIVVACNMNGMVVAMMSVGMHSITARARLA